MADDRPSGRKNWIECWSWKLWICYNGLWLCLWLISIISLQQNRVFLYARNAVTSRPTNSGHFCSLAIFTRESRMLRASLPSSGRLSVCLSVCHTRDLYQNGASYDHEIFTVAAPRSLVYRDKISCHWVQRFPSNEGLKEGYPPKKTSFCRYWLE